jgi:hypothetical protein
MKKILFLLLLIFSGLIYSADLRNFEIIIGGSNPETAGAPIPVTIRAFDTDGNLKTDYSGIVGFREEGSGQIIVDETGTTLTQAFTNGVWEGKIKILRADMPVTIILEDASGATGTVIKNIIPGPYSKLKLIIDGMTFAPGTLTGHTGTWITQTTGALTPAYVTVYACDAYYNTVNANLPTVRVYSIPQSIVTPSYVNFAIESISNTIFSVALVPNPDQSGSYPITAEDMGNSLIKDTVSVYFASLSDFYIWAEAPAFVTAGQNFTVSVKVSHFPPPNTSYVAGFSDAVRICAIDTYGNSTTIPALLPDASPIQSCINGEANFEVSYTWAGQIRIQPDNGGSTDYSNKDNPNRWSNVINILPAAPDSFTFTSNKQELTKGKTAILTATVFDQYLNPVSNTAVNFVILTGSGTLSAASVNTNSIGVAEVIYTAPSINILNVIQATVSALSQSKTVEIVSVKSDKLEIWPNPFNPLKGPAKINFPLDENCKVKIEIFNMFGQKLWSIEKDANKGGCDIDWDGKTKDGNTIGVGLYVVKVSYTDSAGSHAISKKMAVIK